MNARACFPLLIQLTLLPPLSPIVTGAAMSPSSVSVNSNAMRLRKVRP